MLEQQASFRTAEDIQATRRSKVETAQTHAQAVKAELTLAFAFCAVAEGEIAYGRIASADSLILRLHGLIKNLNFHLTEPHHELANSVESLRRQMGRIESRLRRIEQRLKDCP